MTPDTDPRIPSRTDALRAELVAQAAESAPRAPAVTTGRVAVAAVLAFALAGATTGGAVAATGMLTPTSTVELSMEELRLISFPGAEMLGAPLVVTGSGETVVQLDDRPAEATGLALRVQCLDVGRYDIVINDVPESWVQCDTASEGVQSAGGFSQLFDLSFDLSGDGPQSVSVRGQGADRYVVWVSWAVLPEPVEASAAQRDALADGVVTREEYLAGLDRYVACMEASGWSVAVIDREADVVDYRIEAISGDDDARCYAAEFMELDMGWQLSRE
ncbi:hypothetical protein [Microcella frigidaquae]|uniref:Uncharacterized protein n=1 Tax=Microcella frigidaquae TaxID=424758 RepID=A0A840XLK5_9MICO|nr:hypothetical protein [Microcella frigidaquae]MBB5616779.1 hypothetical protein [Microcella frigidaquae]NHN43780.1 hypothetical protein [Microcella frigidaquae]